MYLLDLCWLQLQLAKECITHPMKTICVSCLGWCHARSFIAKWHTVSILAHDLIEQYSVDHCLLKWTSHCTRLQPDCLWLLRTSCSLYHQKYNGDQWHLEKQTASILCCIHLTRRCHSESLWKATVQGYSLHSLQETLTLATWACMNTWAVCTSSRYVFRSDKPIVRNT